MNMEQLLGGEVAVDAEGLQENLPKCHFIQHKFHMTLPGTEPGPPRRDVGGLQPKLSAMLTLSTKYQEYTASSPLLLHLFEPRSGLVGFVVAPLLIFIPPTAPHSLTILSSTLHSLDTDSVVKQPT
jgi:hypothetical protein